jgi:hypothetical protein
MATGIIANPLCLTIDPELVQPSEGAVMLLNLNAIPDGTTLSYRF